MIEFGHSTHVGLRREHNEDTYHADAELGLWLVADGMGGHEHGEEKREKKVLEPHQERTVMLRGAQPA